MTEQRQPDFAGAVEWAMKALRQFVQEGQLVTDLSEPSEFGLRFALQINHALDADGPYYTFPEGADRILHERSGTDRGAFNLYCNIITSRLFRNDGLTENMRQFAGLMVVQRIVPPKASKKQSSLFVVHSYIYWIANYLVMHFDISLTSNDAGPKLSSCDAISVALEKLGHAKSPRAIKEILVGKSSARLRELAIEVWQLAAEWRETDPVQAAMWERGRAEMFK